MNFAANVDHIYLFVSVLPDQSSPQYMRVIKKSTFNVVRTEFLQFKGMGSALWTRIFCHDSRQCIEYDDEQVHSRTKEITL
ncbi:hypothetical protein EFL45_02815 [Weissella confusa]|nr:hypothetical protein [Weissella confusa]